MGILPLVCACCNGYIALGFLHGQSRRLCAGSYLLYLIKDTALALIPSLSHMIRSSLSTGSFPSSSRHSSVSSILTSHPLAWHHPPAVPYCLTPLSRKTPFKSSPYSPFTLLDLPFSLETVPIKLLPLPLHWNSSGWGQQWPPCCCQPTVRSRSLSCSICHQHLTQLAIHSSWNDFFTRAM